MTQLTEHAKTILRAVADGKQLQNKPVHGEPHDISTENALKYIANGYGDGISVKPETISINGRVFAAPVPKCEGNYAVSVSCATGPTIQKWFKAASDCQHAYNAIIDALEGRTK